MAYIENVDTTIFPYNDSDMKYELNLRQYVLTIEGLKKFTGLDIQKFVDSPEEAEAFLIECSTDIYEFAYSVSSPYSIPIKRYIIAKDSNIREEFKRCLAYQCRYGIRSGANLLKDQHGVAIEKQKALNVNSLRGQIGIAKQSESILYRTGLLYSGYMPYLNYDDDGTF